MTPKADHKALTALANTGPSEERWAIGATESDSGPELGTVWVQNMLAAALVLT